MAAVSTVVDRATSTAIVMFDAEPFACVVRTDRVEPKPAEEWSIYDARQWDEATQGFTGRPACGVAATREIGVRIAVAHLG